MSITPITQDKPLVLIVDDEPVVRMFTADSLGQNGMRTAEAEDGKKALSQIESDRPDLVLMDVLMPVMDGFEACRTIRGIPNFSDIPVVMMTGLDDKDAMSRAYEAGATDFITKPLNRTLLINRVRYMLRAANMFNMYRISEQKSKAIIHALPDIVFVLTLDGKILDVKYHDTDDLLAPESVAVGGMLSDLLPPDVAAEAAFCLKTLVETGTPQMFEYDLNISGGTRSFEARMTRISADEVLAIVRDITVRKDNETRLLEYQENLASLVEERTNELTDTIRALKREVVERKRIAETLTMLDTAAMTTRTGITICDTDRRIIYVNPADAQMHGYSPDELIGKDVCIYAPPRQMKVMSEDEYRFCKTWGRECINVRKDGTRFPVKLSSDVLRDENGSIIGMVTTCEDITEAKAAEEELKRYQSHLEELVEERTDEIQRVVGKLEQEVEERKRKEKMIKHLAYYDSLTGLPNRSYLNEQLYYALKNSDSNGTNVALMYVDLDNFKRINDTLGHSMGDVLLKEVSDRLCACLRRTDSVVLPHTQDMEPLVSRLGGDEFIVLIPEIKNLANAESVATRIIKALSEPFNLECHEVFVTPSIGISFYPIHGTDADSLLMKADTAMYNAKEQGKNAYMVYSEVMSETMMTRLVLENDLHKAIQKGELSVEYQPIYDIGTGRIDRLEALLRWNHEKYGNIPPNEFIPIAEQFGLIIPIGDWVLNSVFEQLSIWAAAEASLVPVAVNLSANQFIQHDIVTIIKRLLSKHAVDPSLVELEFTESSLMKNPSETVTRLGMLKKMGVGISIDDFGTGYSSLSHLRKLPLDTIKVDKSFVQDIGADADAEAIIRAIIAMGHSMGLVVVAEGAETEKQIEFLKAYQCDMVQGFYYSRPMPAEKMFTLLETDGRLCA